jgi:hypothetical protein
MTLETHVSETVSLETLKPHPQNYREHPPDQIRHLVQSITEHGIYRNVIVARDGTILGGHGVVQAATEAGLTELPVVRLPIDPDDPKALKILTADNEIGRLAEIDDRALTEILKEIADEDDLFGTGFDENMLANLLFVTRNKDEIGDKATAEEWAGLPGFEPADDRIRLMIDFDSEEDRDAFVEQNELPVHYRRESAGQWNTRWPPDPNAKQVDLTSVKFE